MKKRILVLALAIAMVVIGMLPVSASDSAASTHTDSPYGFRSVLSKNSTNVMFGCYGEFTSYPSGLNEKDIGATLYLRVNSLPNKYGSFDYPTTYGSISKGTGGGAASSARLEINYYYTGGGMYTADIRWNPYDGFTIYS